MKSKYYTNKLIINLINLFFNYYLFNNYFYNKKNEIFCSM